MKRNLFSRKTNWRSSPTWSWDILTKSQLQRSHNIQGAVAEHIRKGCQRQARFCWWKNWDSYLRLSRKRPHCLRRRKTDFSNWRIQSDCIKTQVGLGVLPTTLNNWSFHRYISLLRSIAANQRRETLRTAEQKQPCFSRFPINARYHIWALLSLTMKIHFHLYLNALWQLLL